MITGLRLYRRYRIILSYINYLRFSLRKLFLGFDFANSFLQGVDKYSIQLILKKNGASIGDNCDIETGLIFHNCTSYSNLYIGNNCHIGKSCFFDLRDIIKIKDNCVISMRSIFVTHVDMNKSKLRDYYPAKQKQIIIERNTFIGANSTLLMGVVVEENSIVAANALVINKVKSYTMVGGIPAKLIKTIK